MSTKVLLIFLFFSYFLIQSFLFFLFSECRVSYFPIFLSDQAAGHPAVTTVTIVTTVTTVTTVSTVTTVTTVTTMTTVTTLTMKQ